MGDTTKDCKSFLYTLGLGATLSISAIAIGFNSAVMSEMNPFLKSKFNWSKEEEIFFESVISSSFPFGGIFGVILSFFMIGAYGRKTNMNQTDIIFIFGTFITLFGNIWSIVIGRFLIGVASGFCTVLVPLFLNEISTNEIRGMICGIIEPFFGIGIFFAYLLNLLLPIPNENGKYSDINDNTWRYNLSVTMIISLIQMLIVNYYYNFESPLYFLIKKEKVQSELMLRKVVCSLKIDKYMDELNDEYKRYEQESSISIRKLLKKPFRIALIYSVIIVMLQKFVGVDIIVFFSQKIFNGNFSVIQSRYYQIVFSVLKFLSAGITALIIDKCGKRNVFVPGLIGLSISLFFLYYSTVYNMSSLKIMMLFLYITMFGFSLGPAVWMIIAELLPERGISLAIGSNWIVISLIVLYYPYMISNVEIKSLGLNGESISYLIFFIVSIIAFFFFAFYLPETTNKSRQEIYRELNDPQGLEDIKDLEEKGKLIKAKE